MAHPSLKLFKELSSPPRPIAFPLGLPVHSEAFLVSSGLSESMVRWPAFREASTAPGLGLPVPGLGASFSVFSLHMMKMLCCYTHVFTDQSFSCLRESVGPWASMDIVYIVYFKTDKSEAVMLLGFYIYRKTIIHI